MEEAKVKVKTCRNCGTVFSTRDCGPCASKRFRERYQNDPEFAERVKAKARAYSKSHPEKQRARAAAFRASHPEKAKAAWARSNQKVMADPEKLAAKRARGAKYMRENYEKNRAEREAYRAANSAKIVAGVADWRRRNPGAVARHISNRRARRLKAEGNLSLGLSEKLFALQKGKCACCGQPLGKNYHLDHIMPLAKGGLNVDSNIQLLRARCNGQKGAKDPIEFMQQRGKLL